MTNQFDTNIVWRHPDLHIPQPFDTIFFDVDGVLIQTISSFHATDIAVAEYVTSTIHGLQWDQHEGQALVTIADVDAFKQAGGFNNDWDMCYLLASLSTARLREWRATPLAERSIHEWAAQAREAHLRGHGGRAWVEATIPASARMDYQEIGDLYHEIYWGADGFRRWFGQEPHYLPDAPGFVQTEEMLFAADFPARLRQAGIQHLGMITGRVGPEVTSALERMEAYCGERWWEVVVPADICPKPDPRALRMAIDAVHAQGGLYIGDTADDYDLVRLYRANQQENEPDFIAAMLVQPAEVELYKGRGADMIVRSVEALLPFLT